MVGAGLHCLDAGKSFAGGMEMINKRVDCWMDGSRREEGRRTAWLDGLSRSEHEERFQEIEGLLKRWTHESGRCFFLVRL